MWNRNEKDLLNKIQKKNSPNDDGKITKKKYKKTGRKEKKS